MPSRITVLSSPADASVNSTFPLTTLISSPSIFPSITAPDKSAVIAVVPSYTFSIPATLLTETGLFKILKVIESVTS